jgi:hypothetical protein
METALSADGLLLQGALPFELDAGGGLTFVSHEHVEKVATPGSIVSIATADDVEIGLTMVDGDIRSTISAPGLSSRARHGVLLRTATETLLLLVAGVQLGTPDSAPVALEVEAMVDRATKLLRVRRSLGG